MENEGHCNDCPRRVRITLTFFLLLIVSVPVELQKPIPFDSSTCGLSSEIKNEIASYKNIVNAITSKILKGYLKGVVYNKLADFVDTFGARVAGSSELERTFEYLRFEMLKIGFTNVHTEPVVLPYWVSGPESTRLVEPWEKTILSKAVRYSISTPPEGIRAEVVILQSGDELEKSPEKFKGKIVGCPRYCSSTTVGRLSKLGALAILTVEPYFGIYGIHYSGSIVYDETYPRIPVTHITPQDMGLFQSIYRRRTQRLVLELKMVEPVGPVNVPDTNLFGDYAGSVSPNEIFGLGAHVDMVELGQGAQDDGFAVIFVLETIKLFLNLNLHPRRTLRAMFWTGEEIGRIGSLRYLATHKNELKDFQAMMESDSGCMTSIGLLYQGTHQFGCIMFEVHKLIKPFIQGLDFSYREDWSSDMQEFGNMRIPTIGLKRDPKYFRWIQHTNADTMTAVKSSQLDKCFATYAAVAYVISDIKTRMPRD